MSVPQSIIDSAKAVESWLEEQNAAPPPETKPQFLIRIGYSNFYKVDNAVLFNAGMNIALATALKVPSSPRTGGVSAGITYVVFPGSGKGYQEMDVWSAQADRVFRDWGGMPRLNSIPTEDIIS